MRDDSQFCFRCGSPVSVASTYQGVPPRTDLSLDARASAAPGAGSPPIMNSTKRGASVRIIVIAVTVSLIVLIWVGIKNVPPTEQFNKEEFCTSFPEDSSCPNFEQARTKLAEATKSRVGKSSQSPSSAGAKPAETPIDPVTLKLFREKWIRATQEELWRQGIEMTFQARGTTLHVEYIMAGKAFAFNFGETFVHKNAETLRTLGFKRVELLDGDAANDVEADHRWSWNLTK